jgi:hypothetical protein
MLKKSKKKNYIKKFNHKKIWRGYNRNKNKKFSLFLGYRVNGKKGLIKKIGIYVSMNVISVVLFIIYLMQLEKRLR